MGQFSICVTHIMVFGIRCKVLGASRLVGECQHANMLVLIFVGLVWCFGALWCGKTCRSSRLLWLFAHLGLWLVAIMHVGVCELVGIPVICLLVSRLRHVC